MAYNFDTIASTYDRLNRVMTLGLDRCWRKRAVREFSTLTPSTSLHFGKESKLSLRSTSGTPNSQFSILDVACGTGDMCVELMKRGCTVTGIDLSEEMLAIAHRKCIAVLQNGSSATKAIHEPFHETALLQGDAERLPFEDATFDAVTCAFGVRNFVHLEQGLNEMLRVLKPGGRIVILELATPDSKLIRPFYNLYTKHIIPLLGKWLAGNREAYTYLPESIERFPKGEDFLKIILNSQFSILNCRHRRLTFGVCRLYVINKGDAK